MKALLLGALLLLGVVILAVILLGPDSRIRNWEVFPDMAYSAAYRPQSVNPYFPDGQTQRPEIPGTIARGYLPFDYGTSFEEVKRAGQELRSPFDGQRPPDLERGKHLYAAYCEVCHGASGAGGGPVTQRGFPPPPSLVSGASRSMPDGQLYHLITLGQRLMPAYGSLIVREDRWQVVHYLRQLQQEAP